MSIEPKHNMTFEATQDLNCTMMELCKTGAWGYAFGDHHGGAGGSGSLCENNIDGVNENDKVMIGKRKHAKTFKNQEEMVNQRITHIMV